MRQGRTHTKESHKTAADIGAPVLLTVRNAAEIAGVTEPSIHRLIKEKQLDYLQSAHRGRIRVYADSLVRWIHANSFIREEAEREIAAERRARRSRRGAL